MKFQEHETIWLQPWCYDCKTNAWGGDRQWCQDDVFEDCPDCGAKTVKYVLAREP